MKFTALKENLERALISAERFTGKNLTLPVLVNLLLETDEATLKISATNLEYAVQLIVPGRGAKKGVVCVPAKIISSLIQAIKEEKITLEERQGNLLISTEQREIKINGVPVEDFPIIPKVKKVSAFAVERYVLVSAIEKTLPAVALSEFKPELNGIFFQIQSLQGKIAATDTFRLAEKSIELTSKGEGVPLSFILPYRIAQEITRLWNREGDDVKATVGESQILLESSGVKVVSRLIDGNFPDYAAVIPKTHDILCEVSRDALIDAVRASSIFSSKLQEVKMHFKDKTLSINATNPEIGEYKTSLPISAVKQELNLNFNNRYLMDGLNVIEGEKCFMGLGSASSPTLLRGSDDPAFLYILMPIQSS